MHKAKPPPPPPPALKRIVFQFLGTIFSSSVYQARSVSPPHLPPHTPPFKVLRTFSASFASNLSPEKRFQFLGKNETNKPGLVHLSVHPCTTKSKPHLHRWELTKRGWGKKKQKKTKRKTTSKTDKQVTRKNHPYFPVYLLLLLLLSIFRFVIFKWIEEKTRHLWGVGCLGNLFWDNFFENSVTRDTTKSHELEPQRKVCTSRTCSIRPGLPHPPTRQLSVTTRGGGLPSFRVLLPYKAEDQGENNKLLCRCCSYYVRILVSCEYYYFWEIFFFRAFVSPRLFSSFFFSQFSNSFFFFQTNENPPPTPINEKWLNQIYIFSKMI